MKSSIKKKTDSEVTLSISAEAHEIKHAQEHTLNKYRGQVKAAGFRPGKAPDHIVIREVGDTTIQSEVIDHAMSHAYGDAVREHGIQVVASPKIDIEKWVPYDTLEFVATIEVVPPIKLVDYKNIKKAKAKIEIKDSQIDTVIEDLQRRTAKRVPALRPAEMDDEVKFDFEGKLNGEIVPGAVGKDYSLKLGSNTFIPGFEPEMVGLKVGDSKTFTVTFPKDYHEKSLAGQPVEFKVDMHEVSALELPKVDDQFASEVGPFKNVKELRADIKDQLMAEAETEAKRTFENELLEDIIKKTDVKAPSGLVSQQIERIKGEMSQRLEQAGLNMEQYLEGQKKSQQELEKEVTPEAEKRVKLALILTEVAKAEKLSISNDEIENEIEALKVQYTDPKMQEELRNDHVREDIYNHLMATKVINKLVEYAQK
jgi:trigger factor